MAQPHQPSRFDLPGYNLPLNYVKGDHPGSDGMFPNALDTDHVDGGWTSQRMQTLREFTMLRIMNQITDKVGWENKIFDEQISSKWKKEAVEADGADVTDRMMDWVIDELRWKAKSFKETKMVVAYDGDVVKSDDAVPPALNTELRNAVHSLEDVPPEDKDWHPNSDSKVLDLVHPSLFPLVYGHSHILPDSLVPLKSCKALIGAGEKLMPRPDAKTEAMQKQGQGWRPLEIQAYSPKFQWLPCDVELQPEHAEDEQPWKITSYINNLDPQRYEKLYCIIEKIISKTVPLWNQTLKSMQGHWDMQNYGRIEYSKVEYDLDPEDLPYEEPPEYKSGDDSEAYLDTEQAYYDRQEERKREMCHLILPEPGTFEPPQPQTEDAKIDLKRQFGHRGLQVIVKLANIHLTPDKPEYEGGSWHVEGQLNEHICATSIYYYDVENITESNLSFRQMVDFRVDDVSYAQDDHGFLGEIFGCEQGGPPLQEIGSVVCKEGRLLTFPNVLHHRVEPFRLQDPSKPGHRKILALFLVDPNLRIISTANIPPQRRDWAHWATEELQKEKQDPLDPLPQELKEFVKSNLAPEDSTMTLEFAKELRLELMAERTHFVKMKDQDFKTHTFSLCEH